MESVTHCRIVSTISSELNSLVFDSMDMMIIETPTNIEVVTPQFFYRISVMDTILALEIGSKIANFILLWAYEFFQVPCLPLAYNGNIVLKLLPSVVGHAKGLGL